MEEVITVNQTSPLPLLKRVSWPAVFAGVVIALAIQLVLSLLGLGIGASTIDPLREQSPMSGIGTGSALWFGITTILALFFGGWAAGRLAGLSRKVEASLHGLLTWGFATLLLFYFLNSVIGGLISGAAGVVGRGVSAVGSGLSTMAPQVAEMAREQMQGLDLSAITNDAKLLLQQSGKTELQPETLQSELDQSATDAGMTAERAAAAPSTTDAELNALIARIFSKGEATLQAADKEALVNIVVARSTLTPEEASQRVDQWQAAALVAQQKWADAREAAAQRAREVGDATAKGISRAALLSFVALVLGAVAAAFGAIKGMPRDAMSRVDRPDGFGIPAVQRPLP